MDTVAQPPVKRWPRWVWLPMSTVAFIVILVGVLFTPPALGNEGQFRKVQIQSGMAAVDVGRRLEQAGVVRNALVFRWMMTKTKTEHSLRPGLYEFRTDMDLLEVIDRLVHGRSIVTTVVIPEGFTVEDIANSIEKAKLGTHQEVLKQAKSGDFVYGFLPMKSTILKYRLEGYLFPATYRFTPGTSVRQILSTMLERFRKELDPTALQRLHESNRSVQQWVTLASLVEGEISHGEDGPKVAGVFTNRLNRNMPLQSDVTVQYLLPDHHTTVYYNDLRTKSPYNTYQNRGLPPGPVNSPGRRALMAALEPAKTDYLYFVAGKDGRNLYASSLAEHEHNIRIIRRK